MKEIFIIGAGGHGTVIAEIAEMLGYRIIAFVDDNASRWGSHVLDWEIVGGLDCVPDDANVAIGIGDNKIRSQLYKKVSSNNWQFPMLIHPTAVISSSAIIGAGTVTMAQAVINARSRIGQFSIINTSCSVDHDCEIGDFAHIAPGTHMSGGIRIGQGSLIGVGSCIKPNTQIGSWTTIGAGSVVIHDIPDNVTVMGNPARTKENPLT